MTTHSDSASQLICSKCQAPNLGEAVFCGKCGSKLDDKKRSDAEEKDPLIGSFVGDRFLVRERLGEGGMGVVYRAEQTAINRMVALKVLHPHLTKDESLHARFHNEAAAASRLTHPNTVTIYDFGRTDTGSLYIAMEFVKGKSLDCEISENGAMSEERAVHIATQMCGSLQDAHDNNIVHRDLKPENAMLCARGGETDVVKVLDFGIAKILEEEGQDQRKALTKTGMVFGTPQYMSPEQIRGEKVDNRADIYSMGVIVYQMLTGVLPFRAETPMGLLSKHLTEAPEPLKTANPKADVSQELESAVMSALEKDPGKRPETMKELSERLARAVAAARARGQVKDGQGRSGAKPEAAIAATQLMQGGQALPATVLSPTQGRGRGKKTLGVAVVAAIVIAAGAAFGWYFMFGPGKATKEQTIAQQTVQALPPAGPALPPAIQPPRQEPILPQTQPAAPSASTNASAKNESKKGKTAAGKGSAEEKLKSALESGIGSGVGEKVDLQTIVPVDTDKGSDDKEKEPEQAVVQSASCSFAGSADVVAIGILKRLKNKEERIKSCSKEGTVKTTLFSFAVSTGRSVTEDVVTIKSSVMDDCLKKVLVGNFGVASQEDRRGTASFTLEQKGGTVTQCKVKVETRPVYTEVKPKLPEMKNVIEKTKKKIIKIDRVQ